MVMKFCGWIDLIKGECSAYELNSCFLNFCLVHISKTILAMTMKFYGWLQLGVRQAYLATICRSCLIFCNISVTAEDIYLKLEYVFTIQRAIHTFKRDVQNTFLFFFSELCPFSTFDFLPSLKQPTCFPLVSQKYTFEIASYFGFCYLV